MKIDCHTHLVGLTPESGCYISPRMARSPAYRYLKWKFGLFGVRDLGRLEERYVERLRAWVGQSELERAVLLSFDEVYTREGEVDRSRTHTYVANDFVATTCRRSPDVFLFGASVHPYRRDALDELTRVRENGAVLVKLLPNSHGFDPAEQDLVPYYRRLADLGMPLLLHGGYEHTIPPINQGFGDPERFRAALDEGVTVIVAHAGTAGLFHRKETMGAFLRLIQDYPHCYGDSSALTNYWRAKYLHQLLDPNVLEQKYGVRIEDPFSKILHGSDFPIPISTWAFRFRLREPEAGVIRRLENPFQQDIAIKRALGVPEACLTRAYKALNIGRMIE